MGWPDPFSEMPKIIPFTQKKPDFFFNKVKSQPMKYIFWLFMFLLFFLLFLVLFQRFVLGFTNWADFTGFGEYLGKIPKENRGKTLWDILEILLIPAFLSAGVIWLNWKIRSTEKEKVEEQQREIALQMFIDKMSIFVRGREDTPLNQRERILSRTYTITTLRMLDGFRKGILIQFLFEAGLLNIQTENPLNLRWADFSNSQMDYLVLLFSNFRGCYMKNASMKNVFMRGSNLSRANLDCVNFQNAYLKMTDFSNSSLVEANLDNAVLSYANFYAADLNSAIFSNSFLEGANFSFSNLMNTDFSNAKLFDVKFEGAQLKNCIFDNASMPDGEIYDPNKHTVKYLTLSDENEEDNPDN